MKSISVADCLKLLAETRPKGANFVTLVTDTEVRLLKSAPVKYSGCRKLAKINGIINTDYESAVNKKLGTDDFQAGARKWGTRVGNTCIIQHKGENYVELNVQRTMDCIFKKGAVKFKKDDLKPFFPSKTPSPVQWRTYNINNIKYIRLNKQLYQVV